MRVPADSPVTLVFGSTDSPYSVDSPHRGVDFAYIPDNTVYAPFSGVVTLIPNNGNDGNGVYMTDAEGRFHGLLHTSEYIVSDKQSVVEGQPVAIMGATGYAIGVHLHWAVKENGQFIDPLTLVGGTMQPATFEEAQQLSQTTLLRPVPMSREEWDKYHAGANRTYQQLNQDWASTQEAKDQRYKCWDYDPMVKRLTAQADSGYTVVTEPLFRKNK